MAPRPRLLQTQRRRQQLNAGEAPWSGKGSCHLGGQLLSSGASGPRPTGNGHPRHPGPWTLRCPALGRGVCSVELCVPQASPVLSEPRGTERGTFPSRAAHGTSLGFSGFSGAFHQQWPPALPAPPCPGALRFTLCKCPPRPPFLPPALPTPRLMGKLLSEGKLRLRT